MYQVIDTADNRVVATFDHYPDALRLEIELNTGCDDPTYMVEDVEFPVATL